MCVLMCTYVCPIITDVRGQFVAVSSLPCGPWVLNSGCYACWQAPLLTETSSQHFFCISFKDLLCFYAFVRGRGVVCTYVDFEFSEAEFLGDFQLSGVGSENQTLIFCKSNRCYNHWAISPTAPLPPSCIYNYLTNERLLGTKHR